MSAVNMHGNRACFTPECDVHHARLGVQHNGSELARFPCNMTPFILHPRGCNTGQPLTYVSAELTLVVGEWDNQTRHALRARRTKTPTGLHDDNR